MATAVPKDAGDDLGQAPPGHRYRLYWSGWTSPVSGRSGPGEKDAALRDAARVTREAQASARALVERRRALLSARDAGRTLHARRRTTAPLVTGTGIEHPNENGFAFYDPHGLPYVPGSSIKGALRRAAEELARDREGGWTVADVWYLFGFDGTDAVSDVERALRDDGVGAFEWMRRLLSSEVLRGRDLEGFLRERLSPERDRESIHYRGALVCHDALIEPGADLRVDIINPHHGDYYRGTQAPSDDESPRPIKLLAVAPGATVDLWLELAPRPGVRSPGAEDGRWKALAGAALDHAGTWTGFGAKTSVGYGRLGTEGGTRSRAAASPGGAPSAGPSEVRWEGCRLDYKPSDGSLAATRGKDKAEARGADAQRIREALPAAARERLEKKKELKGVAVRVRIVGNTRTLVAIEEPS